MMIHHDTKKAALIIIPCLAGGLQAAARGGGKAPMASSLSDPLALTLITIITILLLAICLLAFVVAGAGEIYRNKSKEKKTSPNAVIPVAITALLILPGSSSLMAQESAAAATMSQEGISPLAFYLLVSIIMLELLVLFALLYNLWILIRIGEEKPAPLKEANPKRVPGWKKIWAKLNSFKTAEQEADIVLDHNYDGIRELDNRLPPWWLYGFYLSIIVSVVYMWRHHISHAAPSGVQEYEMAMQRAEVEKQVYLKNAANNVNENTVTYLNGETDLEAGKAIFTSMCAACHGMEGQGVVGPNLTDDYWLHGGGLQDIFKVIKYGVPEKGMRSWQDDYSPRQLAQITSYVKSLRGNNPPNPKEKQGELYVEDAAATDSTALAPAQ